MVCRAVVIVLRYLHLSRMFAYLMEIYSKFCWKLLGTHRHRMRTNGDIFHSSRSACCQCLHRVIINQFDFVIENVCANSTQSIPFYICDCSPNHFKFAPSGNDCLTDCIRVAHIPFGQKSNPLYFRVETIMATAGADEKRSQFNWANKQTSVHTFCVCTIPHFSVF